MYPIHTAATTVYGTARTRHKTQQPSRNHIGKCVVDQKNKTKQKTKTKNRNDGKHCFLQKSFLSFFSAIALHFGRARNCSRVILKTRSKSWSVKCSSSAVTFTSDGSGRSVKSCVSVIRQTGRTPPQRVQHGKRTQSYQLNGRTDK